ncbi:hypothetical protein Vadar_013079 [Vaccinium darrowii]|uniref:Uncharacterized protein n=1 Tax=Vaccinium darrowii TaxID=229202 RepID=A0ACB7XHV1_9ERIC|nr:hypothetical protein Vadar_013079 [Vaccinium darrowii]
MKRGTKPRGFHTHKVDKDADKFGKQQNQNSGPSITDLPSPLAFNILLRLPTKGLLICRCVCKSWRSLISDHEFAKQHFLQAESFPLIRTLSRTHISRNLYLAEPPEHSSGCDLHEYCGCYGDAHYMSERHCHMKLETKLKIPLRNAELAMNCEGDANVSSNSKGGTKRKRCIKLRPKDHKLNLVNSCNGFLCLSEPSQNDPVVVCNPITCEFINLPVLTEAAVKRSSKRFSDCGLGFSPKTNDYKVIRMFDQRDKVWVRDPITGKEDYSRRVAEIHTLGTGSWKRIGHAPSSKYGYKLRSPSYLNGALHWLLIDYNNDEHIAERNYIVSFNFDKEIFVPVPPPPRNDAIVCLHGMEDISLGVLRDWLCICDHDESPGFMVHGVKSNYEAIAYTPSFISLKDAVMGDNSPVLNIKSRCAGLRLQGEAKALFLREENEKNLSPSRSLPNIDSYVVLLPSSPNHSTNTDSSPLLPRWVFYLETNPPVFKPPQETRKFKEAFGDDLEIIVNVCAEVQLIWKAIRASMELFSKYIAAHSISSCHFGTKKERDCCSSWSPKHFWVFRKLEIPLEITQLRFVEGVSDGATSDSVKVYFEYYRSLDRTISKVRM